MHSLNICKWSACSRILLSVSELHTHTVAHKKVYDKEKFIHQLAQAYAYLERAAIYSAELISQQYIEG